MKNAGSTPDHANVMAPPPLVYAVAVLAGIALHHWAWPLPIPLDSVTADYVGWAIMLGGLGLLGWAMLSFSRARTAIIPYNSTTSIVPTGPYRFSRNPMYVAMAIIQVAFGIMFETAWTLVLLPPVLAIIHFGVIMREERYLEGKFGAGYLDYKSRVRRWL